MDGSNILLSSCSGVLTDVTSGDIADENVRLEISIFERYSDESLVAMAAVTLVTFYVNKFDR